MAVNKVYSVGKIDIEIYKCVTEDIQTDEVIITCLLYTSDAADEL